MRPPIDGVLTVSQLFGGNPKNETYDSTYPWNGGAHIIGHDGVDVACDIGTHIYPVWDGYITSYFYGGGFGTCCLLHDAIGGRMFLYAHLSKIYVGTGSKVWMHQAFGETGSTGNSTGPHLHASLYLPPLDKLNGYGGASDWLSSLDHDVVSRLYLDETNL